MDPIEGNDGVNPLQNRVSVDNQTDISSSNYAAGVNDAIAKGDEKLGKEISELDSSVKESIEGIGSGIADNTKRIEDAATAAADAREAILDTVVFNAGDESDELTSERLQELITDFKEEMSNNIDIVRNEDSSEKEIRIATFWLSQFGEVYTPLGFNLWQLKDFSSVEDDLDSATMETYEKVIEELRSEILKFKKMISSINDKEEAGEELSEEEKGMREEAEKELKSIEGNFIRWTDPNDATPDVVEDRVTTLEKGLQWRFDADDNAMDAFKEDLMRNVIGVSGAGEYYKEMSERFEEEAANAKTTIVDYEARVQAEEPHSQEQELEKAKADYFIAKFGTIASVVAIKSFEDYNDSYNSVQWDEETYNEYLNEVSELVSVKGKIESDLAQAEKEGDENQASALKEELKSISDRLTSYTCNSGLNPYLECLDGYVNWYVTRHDSEFEAFQDNLSRNVLGTISAGNYYKEMTERFEEEAANAKSILEDYKLMDESGEPISPEFEVKKAKADFFVNQFGTIASIVAIKAYEDYRDGFNAVQWDEETYQNYVSEVNELTDVKGKIESELAAAIKDGNDPEIARLKEELKDVSDKIRSYTCENGVDGDVVCLDGYVAWYVYTHDTEFKRYRDEATEENGFNPSVDVEYLESKKADFKEEMEDALQTIKDSQEEGNEVDEDLLKDAMDFVQRFGRISNSQTAFHNWLAYKAEGRVSAAVSEILNIVECVNRQITDEVNDKIITTSTEVASYYPLADGNISEFNLIGTPDVYKISQVFINGIAANFTANVEDNTVDFGFAPHAGASLTILLESSSKQTISYVALSDNCEFVLPEELTSYDSYECDAIERQFTNLQLDKSRIERSKKSDENKLKDGEDTQSELETLENKFLADQKAGEESLTKDQDEKDSETAKLEKTNSDKDGVSAKLADVNKDLESKQEESQKGQNDVDKMEVQLQIKQLSYDVEAARPFPNEDKLATLLEEIGTLKKSIDEQKTTNETLDAEIKKLTTESGDLTVEVETLTNEVATIEDAIGQLNESILKQAGMLKLISSNLKLVADKKDDFKKVIDLLKADIEEAESVIAQYAKKGDDLMKILKEKGCKINPMGRAAIAHNDDTFELMDENLDFRALNEDGTEMTP